MSVDQVASQIGRPPKVPYGRVFRLDRIDPNRGERGGARTQFADGVIAPDGAALARVRETGVVLAAPGGVEDLVATVGDPLIRIVYRTEPNEI